MGLLLILERELRVSARKLRTFVWRVVVAMAALVLFAWLAWIYRWQRFSGQYFFVVFSWVGFGYCLFIGAAWTADSLSEEKRDGTIGLLYLTDLRSLHIVVGKLFAAAIQSVFGLLAALPVLALTLLLGGVTHAEFWRVILSWCSTLWFSLCVGILCSAWSLQHRQSLARAQGLLLLLGFGFPLIGYWLRVKLQPLELIFALQLLSPFSTVKMAFESGWGLRSNHYWLCILSIGVTSLLLIALASWLLGRVWQRQINPEPNARRSRRRFRGVNVAGTIGRAMRDANPIYWLAARDWHGGPLWTLFAVAIFGVAVVVLAPVLARTMGGPFQPLQAQVFAVTWVVILLQLSFLLHVATISCHRVAEDRHSGALELWAGTPLTVSRILRGIWQAWRRHLLFPGTAIVVIHFFYLCAILVLFDLDTGGGGKLWPGLVRVMASVIESRHSNDAFSVLCVSVFAPLMLSTWATLGWVGIWFGLRVRKPRHAPILTTATVLAPPWLFFGGAVSVAHYLLAGQMESSKWLLFCLTLCLAIVLFYNSFVCLWVWLKVSREFRNSSARFRRSEWRHGFIVWRRRLKWLLAMGSACAVVVLFAWSIENWRGRRAWEAYVRAKAADGVSFDWQRLVPAPVPDRENFAMTPLLAPLFDYSRVTGRLVWADPQAYDKATRLGSEIPAIEPNGTQFSGRIDLRKWLAHFHRNAAKASRQSAAFQPVVESQSDIEIASSVRAAIEVYQPVLDEVREASKRRYTRFNIHYEEGPRALLPHLNVISALCRLLAVEASADLVLGRPRNAFENINLIFRLADRLAGEPVFVSWSVRRYALDLGASLIMHGLTERQWTEGELLEFEQRLKKMDAINDFHRALAVNQAWTAFALSTLRETRRVRTDGEPAAEIEWLFWLPPRGWFYFEQLNYARLIDEQIAPIFDLKTRRVFPSRNVEAIQSLAEILDRRHPIRLVLRHRLVAAYAMPQLDDKDGHPLMFARLQVLTDQARIACAIERYRMANGECPSKLEKLVPTFIEQIPNDIFTGAPMRYVKLGSDEFSLYSVGWDETDDGGSVVEVVEGDKLGGGDWVFGMTNDE